MRGAGLVAAWLALLVGGCGAEPGGPQGPQETAVPAVPPNLLLISIDTLRADALACYGGEADVGVAICALAEGGTRFEWAFAAAPATAPSVASLLTSRYPGHHGVSQLATSYLKKQNTLAPALQGAGYTTAAVVSNPVLRRYRNFDHGFDLYDTRMTRRERNRPRAFEREAEATTDAALAWAATGPASPWFLWVHFQDPHGPYEPPGAAPALDDPDDEALPHLSVNSGLEGIPKYQLLPGLHTRRAYEQRYRDEIRYLEPHLERLLEGIAALGEPPAILLTSDHGEAFGEDGFYFAHGHSVGLDQIRVPLIFRPARPGKTRVVQSPVSLLDVAPTLLELAGVEAPDSFQGRPLPLDGDEPGDALRPVFAEHQHRAAVVVGRRYYSRDRKPAKAVPWYPTRTARLPAGGPLPAYAFPGAQNDPLEPLLREFIESEAGRAAGAHHPSVPEDVKEQMRALGYLDE